MRTDATIDKVQVKCPNASHLGYDKWRAQVGDLILFNDQGKTRLARMVARVHYAPALQGDSKPIKDFILGAILDEMLSHVGERWIDPADITRVQSIREQRKTVDWFLSDDMTKQPIHIVRLCISELWHSFAAFKTWFDKSRNPAA